jgi:hypothetical protein
MHFGPIDWWLAGIERTTVTMQRCVLALRSPGLWSPLLFSGELNIVHYHDTKHNIIRHNDETNELRPYKLSPSYVTIAVIQFFFEQVTG